MEGDRIVMPDLTGFITKDAPPFLMYHGTKDETVSCKESEDFYDALTANGIRADLYLIEGAHHADAPLYQTEIKEQIAAFAHEMIGK